MIKETMTPEQRMWAAIRLEPVDRVPIAPIIAQFAWRQNGLSRKTYEANPWLGIEAIRKNFDDLGGYDAKIVAGLDWPHSTWRSNGPRGKSVPPGKDGIPDDFSVQYDELENMTVADYDTIINKGWNGFCEEYFPRVTGRSLEQIERINMALLDINLKDAAYWKERGIVLMAGALIVSCEMTLSLGRTFPKFTLDLHRMPDKVQAALEAMVPDFIDNVLRDTKASGVPWVHISLERGSGAYYNLKTYERFFFPQLKKIVDTLTARGITCWLHMDTDWTLNIPYLRELPAKKCICNLDSITDIFKAKDILKGHMCIMGDVPPSLTTLGTVDEVVAYCKKLIDVVGKDNGYIMCSGCEVPIDAKFENVRAMMDTARNYYPHRR
jgi:uroporphyrinogen-III decarboxylase